LLRKDIDLLEARIFDKFSTLNEKAELKLMNLFKSILSRLDRNEKEHDLLNDLYKHFEQ
jgi:hypothetical protein